MPPSTTKARIESVLFASGILLLILTCCVSIPLTIVTIKSQGGEWGFEMLGLTILVPLCGYALFGVSGLVKNTRSRRRIFLSAHLISIILGIFYCIVFPIYPAGIVLVPLVFAALGMIDKANLNYYVLVMQILGIAANVTLWVWELNDGRSLPILQLFGQ